MSTDASSTAPPIKRPLTKAQRATLAWLAGPCDTNFSVQGRIWSILRSCGYVTQRNGILCVTAAGRALLKETV